MRITDALIFIPNNQNVYHIYKKKNGRATHRIGRTLNNPHTDGSLHSEFTEKNKHTHTKKNPAFI